jgi:hypothetical protein
MSIALALSSVRYITDAQGEKTDVIVPVETWKTLLLAWRKLVGQLEDQEDRAIGQEWLDRRAVGEVNMASLEVVGQELRADGRWSYQYEDLGQLLKN